MEKEISQGIFNQVMDELQDELYLLEVYAKGNYSEKTVYSTYILPNYLIQSIGNLRQVHLDGKNTFVEARKYETKIDTIEVDDIGIYINGNKLKTNIEDNDFDDSIEDYLSMEYVGKITDELDYYNEINDGRINELCYKKRMYDIIAVSFKMSQRLYRKYLIEYLKGKKQSVRVPKGYLDYVKNNSEYDIAKRLYILENKSV